MTRKRRVELACAGVFGIAVAWWLLPWWMFLLCLAAALVVTHKRKRTRW